MKIREESRCWSEKNGRAETEETIGVAQRGLFRSLKRTVLRVSRRRPFK